jgi:alanyl-tRNA synthetase
MKTSEIRQKFIDYFVANGHTEVPSSPLIPGNDPTLLFTNAGMVQFKETFLGQEKRDYVRAVTSQRCVRAGGKHNDLENVGYTARHHTFFEMLGNFSFGDYFKQEAIRLAWELLTKEFGLPGERLWVTVFEEDDEAADIWINEIGIDPARLTRIGAKDNFWQMGDTGPCGPCSEIFYDHGEDVPGGPPGTPEEDGDRYVEIWNLVFMQYYKDAQGTLNPLPKPSVDTGMGLERMAAVLQHVHSNYEIDLFENLINDAARVLGVPATKENKSLRVIADHVRATAFLIVDGVTPSNEGRGYVLRRIIRRAIRHGYRQGVKHAFMQELVPGLIKEMGDTYPELALNQSTIERVLERENTKFIETLEQGIEILDSQFAKLEGSTLPGQVVFKLYDTFGFPYDLTADYAREQDINLDRAGFDKAMAGQRERARAATKFDAAAQLVIDTKSTPFMGYTDLSTEARVVAMGQADQQVEKLTEGETGAIIVDQTPFYAESGGQAGDKGFLSTQNAEFRVDDTQYLANKVIAHIGAVVSGDFVAGETLKAQVNRSDRRQCAANHSVTHLMHAALKNILGDHVQQKGSQVLPERMRFDFSHFEPVTPGEIRNIENMVNEQIRANLRVDTSEMALDEAKRRGAVALFGEKYEANVRVVEMGEFTLELCGGTHVSATGDIGLFRILSETGIAAGVRRIEVLTGQAALDQVYAEYDALKTAMVKLNATPQGLAEKLDSVLQQNKVLSKKLQTAQSQLAMAGTRSGSESQNTVEDVAGTRFMRVRVDGVDVNTLRSTVDQARNKVGEGVVVVGGFHDGKVTLIVAVSKELTERFQAGKLVQAVMPLVSGRGGGKPEMAQGGGTDPKGLDQALEEIKTLIAS